VGKVVGVHHCDLDLSQSKDAVAEVNQALVGQIKRNFFEE